jgi:protein-tyrosine phosphatase
MVDLHAHLIPGVDEGAGSFDESLRMLRAAEADGIEVVLATPHIVLNMFFSPMSIQKNIQGLDSKFRRLRQLSEENNLSIQVLRGAEVFFDSSLREKLAEYPGILTINDSDYFLLEFPSSFMFPGIKEFIFDVMTDGFIPIVSHPERNRVFQQDPALLYQFMQLGAMCQVDAGSFRGDFGNTTRYTAMQFLKNNLVHVIASDAHNAYTRPPGLSFLYDELKDIPKKRLDMLLVDNPKAIIGNGPPPDMGPLEDPEHKASIFDFFKR